MSRLLAKFPLICFGLVWVYSVVHYVWLIQGSGRGEVRVVDTNRRASIATSWSTGNTLIIKDCMGGEDAGMVVEMAKKLWITNLIVYPSCEHILDSLSNPTFNVILTFSPLLSEEQFKASNLPESSMVSKGKVFTARGDTGRLIDFTSPTGLAYARQRVSDLLARFDSPAVCCLPGEHVLLGKHTEAVQSGITSHDRYSLQYYQNIMDMGRDILGRNGFNFGIVTVAVTTFGSHTDISPIPSEPGIVSMLLHQSGENIIHDLEHILSASFMSSKNDYMFIGYPWDLSASHQQPNKPTHPLTTSLLPSLIYSVRGPNLRESLDIDTDIVAASEFHAELSTYLHSASASDTPIITPVTPLKSDLDTVGDEQSFFIGKDILACPSVSVSKNRRSSVCRIPEGEGSWTFYDSDTSAILQAGSGVDDWKANDALLEELRRLTADGRPLVLKRVGVGLPILTVPGGGSPWLWGQYGMTSPVTGRVLSIIWESPDAVSSTEVFGGTTRDSLQLNYTDDGTKVVMKVSPTQQPILIIIRKLTQPPPYSVSQFATRPTIHFIEMNSLWDIHTRAGTPNPAYLTKGDALFVSVPAVPRGLTLLLK